MSLGDDVIARDVRRWLQAVDVLLEELIPSLNEDMLDLDEYEMGMQENAKPRFELFQNEFMGN